MTSAACTLRVDLRIAPETTPMQAKREFTAAIAELKRSMPGLDTTVDMILAIPGTTTSRESWVFRSAVAGWEALECRAPDISRAVARCSLSSSTARPIQSCTPSTSAS
ncbi:hypothetical protein [Streptomyces sp. SAS_276]|uniref:hypothetical protein n=1 Tax=Streptomyces sp. SAS_276 TaxID=3412745 RepID=UPI00403D52C2